jgi:tetratricopeptide (TPR) repeat protein
MAGEVRFTQESGHRVPHDPLLGLDRSIDLLDNVIDNSMPYSNEELSALATMAKALARRGNFPDSILYFKQALARTKEPGQVLDLRREMGTAFYRMGDYEEAAFTFYQALQVRNNLLDQWLLRVAMDQIKGSKPPIPQQFLFPRRSLTSQQAKSLNLQFEDIAPRLGINRFDGNGTASWTDFDSDGDLDLFEGGSGEFMKVYRNDGPRFTEVTDQIGLAKLPSGYSINLIDYDNDAWPDIFTTSLASWTAVIDGLRDGYHPARNAMHPDVGRLFRNNKNGTFTDVTYEAGLFLPVGVMGAGVADLDNDGYIDLFLGVGDPQLSRLEPNRFFRNNGDGTFTDLTDHVGFHRPGNKGHGVSFVDIDHDGDLDVYAQLGGHYPGDFAYNAFYKNLKGNLNHWLQIDLTGVKSNRNAIGAQITVKAANLTVYREVKGSEGFGATSQLRQHFGLGPHTRIDSLEIRWPSGLTQNFQNLDANQILQITEGSPPTKPN